MKIACPDDEMIADYLEGRLMDKDRFQIEKHLSDCTMCLERFVIATSLVHGGAELELDTVPAEVTEAAVRLVQRKRSALPDSLSKTLKGSIRDLSTKVSDFFRFTPWGEWQLQPIRGSKKTLNKDLILLQKSFNDIETEIEIEKIGANKCNIRVVFPKHSRIRRGVRVSLKKGEREISSHLTDTDYVLFEDIPFGRYSLTFAKDGVTLGTYAFEVRETGCGER